MRMRQKITKQQVMTAKLIGLSTEELEQQIKKEIEENPFLEEVIPDSTPSTPQETPNDTSDDDDFFSHTNYDYDDYRIPHSNTNNDQAPLDYQQADNTSLQQSLLEQLSLKKIDERQAIIGTEIIGNIDESGYITRSLGVIVDDLAIRRNLETTEEEVEQVLHIIQTFDPAGVAARNLQECLLLQLQRDNDNSDAHTTATNIISHHFDDFANKRYSKITRSLNISDTELQEATSIILKLSPKPCDGTETVTQQIIPDFFVHRNADSLSFSINERNLPKLRKDQAFIDNLRNSSQRQTPKQKKETDNFIEKHSKNADDFITALQQRNDTLQLTMSEILKLQQKYFLSGETSDLKPMLQKDIAQATGLDISTVSRVVNQKYVQTEHGTFLLKGLFSTAMPDEEGNSTTTKLIKENLRQIIDDEDKSSPLSDAELTSELTKKGFVLSRRTVAKYRESLGIPVGRLRKSI